MTYLLASACVERFDPTVLSLLHLFIVSIDGVRRGDGRGHLKEVRIRGTGVFGFLTIDGPGVTEACACLTCAGFVTNVFLLEGGVTS